MTDLNDILNHINAESGRSFKKIEPIPQANNSTPYLLDEMYVARFAKDTPKSVEKLRQESVLLKYLQENVTSNLSIPKTKFFKSNKSFSLHKIIPGQAITTDCYQKLSQQQQKHFENDIAVFMRDIHALKPPKDLNFRIWDRYERYPRQSEIKTVLQQNSVFLDHENYLNRFLDSYEFTPPETYNLVLGHCDIMPKNTAFDHDKGVLNGLYDFGDSGFIHLEYEMAQIFLDWSIGIAVKIVQRYETLQNTKLNLEKINDNALYSRLSNYMLDVKANSPNQVRGSKSLTKQIEKHKEFKKMFL